MKKLVPYTRKTICFVNVLALVCGMLGLPLRARAQNPNHSGKPVVITFGQPNIWSLDQAHYLLSQLREQSLTLEAANLAKLDPNETHGSRLSFMRQLFELAAEFTQPIRSGSPEPSPTQPAFPEGTPERVASKDIFDGTVLGALLANPEFQKRLFSDPKLNAITKLDNHIQLQYEIVARQLTLLRDEVRPHERLVFLELPQSIYTTDDKADNKMAQVWWQVDGYYVYDVLAEIKKAIEVADKQIALLPQVDAKTRTSCEEEYPRECSGKDEACKRQQETCSKYREMTYWQRSRQRLMEREQEERSKQARRRVENVLQEGPAEIVAEKSVSETLKTKTFVPVRGSAPVVNAATDDAKRTNASADAEFAKANVRTIDIIPHQSSLNVNDVQETIKSSFISGAFSFLFGLGARTSFQRQRDQFEQFLHQELYASGFGKGNSLFGWTFGPIPGTKRVAPGLRTTFAAVIVPDVAESITLRARGCFFDRRKHEPPDAMNQHVRSEWWDDNDRECGATQNYRLMIPSGGGTRNFWVTGIDYIPARVPSQRMTAIIRGENFSTQVGVLIDGIPLKQVVELTRKLPGSVKNDPNIKCEGICGEYEVIGPSEINIAFRVPSEYYGTPEITVIGPGRSVILNHIPMRVRPLGTDRVFYKLEDDDTPYMFGEGPQVRIVESKLFREDEKFTLGVLRGNHKLTDSSDVFVNGKKLTKLQANEEGQLETRSYVAYFDAAKKLFRVRFPRLSEEKVEIMVVDGEAADTRSIANPFVDPKKPVPLAITDDAVLALDLANGEMAVRLTGTGLANVTVKELKGASAESEITSKSATELILRLVQPKIAVRIKLADPATGGEVSRTIIRRPPPRSITEKRDVVDANKN